MREPTRLRISWTDDLHAEDRNRRRHADATAQVRSPGRSTERAPQVPAGQRSWQGVSVARWEPPPQGGRGLNLGLAPRAGTQGRSLEVVTSQIRPGYLRKNGVPFSENASVTEYFDLFPEPDGPDWFVVTTSVQGPVVSGRRVGDDQPLQEGARRLEVESNALSGSVATAPFPFGV